MSEEEIEQWKMKKLISSLQKLKGSGTSMISLIIPPGDQISRVNKMLTDEYGTASNIKSRVNRLSVLSAITSAQQRLKLYNNVPKNGLVIYCGTAQTDDKKERKININFEPYKPVNSSLYLCDDNFHTEPLSHLLHTEEVFGFIIIDGSGAFYYTLSGNTRSLIQKFEVDLPKKHNKGGQSSVRFARLRVEARHNYVRKCAEIAKNIFIANDKTTVKGLILAGSADFKTVLGESDLFDPRLKNIILKMVDISYGGENGFQQAITLSSDVLANVKFIKERNLISSFFDHIAKNTNKICFGVKDTLSALQMGIVETIIIWENLDLYRISVKDKEEVLVLSKEKRELLKEEVVKEESFQEWLVENYKNYGAKLEFISDKSQEGSQFVKGFGGIGGILQYPFILDTIEDVEVEDKDPLDDFF